MVAYSARVDRAIEFAACAHRTQVRKGTGAPYVMHPFHVAMLLQRHGFAEEVVVAGLLHDVVEDTQHTLDEIRAEFGEDVAAIVATVTETKMECAGGEPARRPWRVRKLEQLAALERATPATAALKAADAIHNCHSTLREVTRVGAAAWARFRAPAEEQLWYFRSIVQCVRASLGEHAIVEELRVVVDALTTAHGALGADAPSESPAGCPAPGDPPKPNQRPFQAAYADNKSSERARASAR